MSNQNVAPKKPAEVVRDQLERMMPQMKMALPRHLTPERLLRVTMTAVQSTPKLLECDRTSFFAAVMTCAQLGLEPDGVMGQAYLVPFRGKVQFIPGYKGLLTLARNSGEISSIQAHEARQNDTFNYAYGLNEHLDHTPAEGERGEITHFYAYAKFRDGGHAFEVMTRAEVEDIRNNSEGYKAFKAGRIKTNPWDTHFVQMGRKTAIRRLANYLPMSVQRAAAIEDAVDRGVPAATDTFGDIVLEGEGTVVDDEVEGEGDAATEGQANATSRLDAVAGDDDDTNTNETQSATVSEPAAVAGTSEAAAPPTASRGDAGGGSVRPGNAAAAASGNEGDIIGEMPAALRANGKATGGGAQLFGDDA